MYSVEWTKNEPPYALNVSFFHILSPPLLGFALSGWKIMPDQVDEVDVTVFLFSFMARVWSAFPSASIKIQPKGLTLQPEIVPRPYCFWQAVRTY